MKWERIMNDRKQMFEEIEEALRDQRRVGLECGFFSNHSSEDWVVLSHLLFWVMSQPLQKKIAYGRRVPTLADI